MAKQGKSGVQATGDPGERGTSKGVISSPRVDTEAASAAVEYWTESAMRDAEPYPLPEIADAAHEGDPKSSAIADAAGGGGLIQAGAPQDPESPADGEEPTASKGGYDYPGPFTRYEVQQALYSIYPWRTIGKVFFTQNGGNYVASASSIGSSAAKGVIWTAGHVVHAGDNKPTGWSTKMVFVPAYRDGNAPFGKWSVPSLSTRTLWYQKGNPDGLTEDMGGGVVAALNGKTLSQVVGWLGFAYNFSRFQHWDSIGYPAASPFNGERMNDCEASYAYDGLVSGIPPIAIGCDMTGGCSGGPWIMQFQTGNYVNGHNSYRRTANPLEINSPLFDARAKSLFDTLKA